MRDAGRTSLWRGLGTRAVLTAMLGLVGCAPMPTGGDGEPTANRAPVPSIRDALGNVDPTSLPQIAACQTLTLNASASTDPDNDTITYSWVFEANATPITTAEASYQYLAAGEYDITLTISDGRNLPSSTASRTLTIEVTEALTAGFTWTPITGQAPLDVDFDSSTSSDCDGDIVSYSWDFDEDGVEDSTDANPSFTFPAGGVYTVSLTVTDEDGNTHTDENDITVAAAPAAPTVSAAADITTAEIDEVITFTATGDDPDGDEAALTYLWDFGDGATANTAVATHSYDAVGLYEVSVTITDAQSLTAEATLNITVEANNEAPVAVISADPLRGLAPLSVEFDGLSSTDDGELFGFCWFFDPDPAPPAANAICDDTRTGGTDPGQQLIEDFNESGDHEVYLYVTDTEGVRSELVSETIEVREVDTIAADVIDLVLEPAATYQLVVTAALDSAFSDGVDEMDVSASPLTVYTSDLPAVATVSETGLITAVAEGIATITIEYGDPLVVAPVEINLQVANELSGATADADVTLIAPGDTVTLTATATGGVLPLTYDWNIVSEPLTSNLTDPAAVEEVNDVQFTPTVEGVYVFNCVVSDSSGITAPVTTNDITVTVTTLSATMTRTDDHTTDICATAGLSDNVPNGANGAPTPFGTPETSISLDANITGGVGALTFEWSASPDIGTLVPGVNGDEITWEYPTDPLDLETDVILTVTVTDDGTGAVASFSYDPFTVIPAPELTDICIGLDTPACEAAPVQINTGGVDTTLTISFYLNEDTGHFDPINSEWTTEYAISATVNPGGAATVAECTAATPFGTQSIAECDVNFTAAANGAFTFRIRLREDCGGGIESGTPRFDNFFTVNVAP